MTRQAILPVSIIALLLGSAILWAQAPGVKTTATKPPAAKALTAQELALQGKIPQAVSIARKTPTGGLDTLKTLMDKADEHVTERQLAEARSILTTAQRFVQEYARVQKGKPLPTEGLKGRQLRLQGIQLSDQKSYAKAEPLLREALALSKQANDAVLEAGVHNNLGYIFLYTKKEEDACKEFTLARDMAEAEKDWRRASSYNFNLGLAHFELTRFEPALNAFKRSAEQSHDVAKTSLEARALLWQGKALSAINVVSPEPIKMFNNAQKLFQGLGDHQGSGLSFFLMAEHTAYTMDFPKATLFAEQAVQHYSTAGDNQGLRQTYEFLAEMYQKMKKLEKSEEYKKKAEELAPKRN